MISLSLLLNGLTIAGRHSQRRGICFTSTSLLKISKSILVIRELKTGTCYMQAVVGFERYMIAILSEGTVTSNFNGEGGIEVCELSGQKVDDSLL
jgi:hypothetical protein